VPSLKAGGPESLRRDRVWREHQEGRGHRRLGGGRPSSAGRTGGRSGRWLRRSMSGRPCPCSGPSARRRRQCRERDHGEGRGCSGGDDALHRVDPPGRVTW